MTVNLTTPVAEQLLPVAGISLGIAKANIKCPDRKDILVMQLCEGASVQACSHKIVFARRR